MMWEILPNARGPLIVDFCLRIGYTTILLGTLGFFGLGVSPESPDWGSTINEGRKLLPGLRPPCPAAGARAHEPRARPQPARRRAARADHAGLKDDAPCCSPDRRPRRSAALRAAAQRRDDQTVHVRRPANDNAAGVRRASPARSYRDYVFRRAGGPDAWRVSRRAEGNAYFNILPPGSSGRGRSTSARSTAIDAHRRRAAGERRLHRARLSDGQCMPIPARRCPSPSR